MSGGEATRLHLREFTRGTAELDTGDVRSLEEHPADVRDSFQRFAYTMAGDGFEQLHQRMQSGTRGPVLVSVRDGRVVGAIGPMEIDLDHADRRRLLPLNFAVLPDHRGKGHGRALWQAAMHWAHLHGASYHTAQTPLGLAADALLASEGFASLGILYTTDVGGHTPLSPDTLR